MSDFNERYSKIICSGALLYTLNNKGKVVGELWDVCGGGLVVVNKQSEKIINLKINKANDSEFYERFINFWKACWGKNIQDFRISKLDTITIVEAQ